MVDKIQKALSRFSAKEKDWVNNLLLQIKNKKMDSLDFKKLKGRDDVYRVRKGNIRIIYRVDEDEIYLLAIERKNEGTYKNI